MKKRYLITLEEKVWRKLAIEAAKKNITRQELIRIKVAKK